MKLSFIETIDTARFEDIISSACERIYLSLPNIHEELAKELLKAKENIDDIRVVLDNSEGTIRNGYGNIDATDSLKSGGVDVFNSPKNRVSFIVYDDEAFFIFPESRIFAYDDIGCNAVKMDPMTQIHLIEYFFPSVPLVSSLDVIGDATSEDILDEKREALKAKLNKKAVKYVDFVKETIEDVIQPKEDIKGKLNVVPLDEKTINEVKEKLVNNPPDHPDLQRQIKTYTAKIQYVELNFNGSNLHIKKITIPPQAMPFKDKKIKKLLETKMRLFGDLESNENFKEFFSFKNKVEKLRKKYLHPIKSKKKNVIVISNKTVFQNEINELKEGISDLNKSVTQFLDGEILKSKERIRSELENFLKENPPEEIKSYESELLTAKIKDISSKILNGIKYPEPHEILNKIDLVVNYYDLTVQDFKDDDFLDELKKQGIMRENEIENIVSFRKAFEVKK